MDLNITLQSDIDRLATVAAADGGTQILVLNTPRPPSPMRDFLDETIRRAGTVAFLASDLAGFITGQTIQLDGGQTLALL